MEGLFGDFGEARHSVDNGILVWNAELSSTGLNRIDVGEGVINGISLVFDNVYFVWEE